MMRLVLMAEERIVLFVIARLHRASHLRTREKRSHNHPRTSEQNKGESFKPLASSTGAWFLSSMEGQHASLLTGPMLFGYISDIFLFGVLSLQIYVYSTAFPRDARLLKVAVYTAYLISATQTAFAMKDLYTLACAGPNSVNAIYSRTPGDYRAFGMTWFNISFSTTLVIFFVQCQYAYCIYNFFQCIPSVIAIIVLSVLQLVVGVWGSMIFMRMASTAQYQWPDILASDAGYDVNILLWGPLNVTSGSFIAICMVYWATRVKSRKTLIGAGPRYSTRIIRMLMKTGILPTSAMIVYTAASLERNVSLYALSGLPLGNLYSISMMVMINSRLTLEHFTNLITQSNIS